MPRKTISILILLLLTVPILAGWSALQWEKMQVRKSVKEELLAGMDHSELVELQFRMDEIAVLEWENDREFEYAGQMYDVVEWEERDGSIICWCFADDAETEVNHRLERLIATAVGTNPDHRNRTRQWERFFQNLYPPFSPTNPLPKAISQVDFPAFSPALPPSHCSAPLVPPPNRG